MSDIHAATLFQWFIILKVYFGYETKGLYPFKYNTSKK